MSARDKIMKTETASGSISQMWNLTSFFSRSTTQQGAAQGEPDETVANNADTSISDADSNPDSSQRTPKASATHTAVPVPELNLQETESTPKKHNQNVSTTTTSMAPPPPPPPPPPPHLRASDTQGQSKLNPSQQQRPPTLKPLSNREFLAPPKPKSSSLLRPTPPSAAATLRTPAALAATSSTLAPGQRPSRKVILGPGHSPLDWAALTKDPRKNLRGANLPPTLIKVTPSMLKIQNGRKGHDAWTSYNGKVYNITPYVSFHPGGKGELLRGAGKDSGKLFLETHPWVNWDGILGECLVGILVSENDKSDQTNELDAMD